MVLCEKTYPKKLAFAYLTDLEQEFNQQHGSQVHGVSRPYAFVKFDTFMQKVKRQYKDSRTQRNMAKLNEDLQDVHRIMTRNIQDVLGRQDALNSKLLRFIFPIIFRNVRTVWAIETRLEKVLEGRETPELAGSVSKVRSYCYCHIHCTIGHISSMVLVLIKFTFALNQ